MHKNTRRLARNSELPHPPSSQLEGRDKWDCQEGVIMKLWTLIVIMVSLAIAQEYQEPQYTYQQGRYPEQGYPYPPNVPNAPNAPENTLYQTLLPNSPQGPGGRREQDIPRFSQRDIGALLNQIDILSSEQCNRNVEAQWLYETNISPDTQLNAVRSQLEYGDFQRALWDIVRKIPADQLQDPRLARQLHFLSVVGPSALPPEQLERYNRLINDMLTVYYRASICAYNAPFRCGLTLEPALTLIMARSRDWDELQHVWVEWRRQTGQKMRDLYEQLVDLSNEAARLNGLRDYADYWMYPYESEGSFRLEVDEVWEQVKPLYEQLHAYVRRKLRDLYGPEKISRQAPLPEHILGNMWGQTWSNILDVTIPYPGKNFLDVTPRMIEQGYTPLAMFKLAEDFYLSLNLSAMPESFWRLSVLEEPPDRPVVCDASAWDFCNRLDYRIKMCTHVNMKDFVTAHHEMGHLQYFLQYRGQPKVFRDGANPGFHEAVGDAVGLSIGTPQHLQTLNLVQRSVDDLPHNINYLFALALDKLAFLPYSYLLDRWRWDIFEGSVNKQQYNCHYYILRERISGIKPPILRSEYDFDPGSKYHVPANIPYIRV
ncbi:angiotensin-converting enzyme [Anabrus simplex]|uniref:angiotensin-converting enzyme n=1 Tax=Anabrus simplex TaxID=316456 RepID=UPI0035A37C88